MWMKILNQDEYMYSEDEELDRLIKRENDEIEIKEIKDQTLMDMALSEFLDILFGKGKIKSMLNNSKFN